MPPTHRVQYLRKIGKNPNESYSLGQLSRFSGVAESILQDVFNRGVGAWKGNPSSVRLQDTFVKNPDLTKFPRSARLSKEQWAYARVYSFLNKGATYKTTDRDLAEKAGY
jgi:hypothetical protein